MVVNGVLWGKTGTRFTHVQTDGLKTTYSKKYSYTCAKTRNNRNTEKNTMFGFDMHQGTSGFSWSFKKNWANKRTVIFSLSSGNAGDAPYGSELIKKLGKQKSKDICLWTKLTKTITLDF